MGKPTNQPRVKGNLKPASSSRAAELASTSNSLSFENLGGFAQFAGASANTGMNMNSRPSTPSSADGSENLGASSVDLDPELVVIMKKITKRDATTKIKALEELEVYLKANTNVIGYILHKWAAMYGKLVLEVDRRVRLEAVQVHALITANAKKKLAPLLKEFIGPWLLAMYDQSKDVARAAQNSFEAVFAADKRPGVISFCQKEILDYATDLLLYKTAETLSDARYVSKEDMATKYGRVVSASLQVVSCLITELSLEERTKCQAEYNIILDDTTMWKKFATNTNPLIRKALYTFIRTLLLNWIDMVEARIDLICPYFYTSVFVEKETSTHSDMWDALLLMTKKLPSSWIIIGKKKPALPKLYHFLRSGLNGSTSITYPSMLALLANLPEELKTTPSFYSDVFENFWKGLSTEFIDRTNSLIFLNSYIECIVYFAITLSKKNDEQSTTTVTALIETAFWDVIKVYFLNSRDKNITDKLDLSGYAVIAKYLVIMASVESVKDRMATFWSNMDELLVQTTIDCGSIGTRAPLDMDVFCKKTGSLLAAIAREVEEGSVDDSKKYDFIQLRTNDVSKRLLVASLESSVVHKDKANGLLLLANQLLLTYPNTCLETEGIISTSLQLLDLFSNGPEDVTPPLALFYVTLLAQLKDKEESNKLWVALMNQVKKSFNTEGLELQGAKTLVFILEHLLLKKVTLDKSYQCEALDFAAKSAIDKLNKNDTNIPRPILEIIVSLSLTHYLSSDLLSDSIVTEIITSLESNLTEFNRYQYVEKKSKSLLEPPVQALKTTLSTLIVLQELFKNKDSATKFVGLTKSIECEIFDAMFVTANHHHYEEGETSGADEELSLNISTRASAIWDLITANVLISNPNIDALFERVKKSILDIQYSASPSDSVRRIQKVLTTACFDEEAKSKAISFILGTEQEWEKMASVPLDQHTNTYLELGITDAYAALSVEPLVEDSGELFPISFDIYGLSSFGRFALFLGEFLSDNQARVAFFSQDGSRDWVMRQLLKASIACEQGLVLPGVCRVYESKATEGIRVFVQNSNLLLSDWFVNSLVPSVENVSKWNEQLLDSVKKQQVNRENRLSSFITHLLLSEENKTVNLSADLLQRLLHRIVILLDWKAEDLEGWLILLKAESKQLHLLIKVAVLVSFKNELSHTQAYNRYQSDLSSKLSGATKIEQFDYSIEDETAEAKNYWSLLTLLNASALRYKSFDIPSQRIMYLIQKIRPVLSQEEDEYSFSSDQQKSRVKAQLAQLLKHLAESAQDVSGSHWNFFLQCCLNWNAFADVTQPEELLVVYNSLDLFDALYTLSADGNEELQEVIQDHLPSLSNRLLDLMVKEGQYLQQNKEDSAGQNKARLVYQTILAELLAYIPEKTLIESECFHNLNTLIHTPNEVLQKRAYLLLKKHIAHRVQDLSVRLEFTETSEEETHADIDKSIIDVLLHAPELLNWQTVGLDEHELHETLGYLLTWMLMFDHFTDITFKLKQEYTAQLKEKEAVTSLMSVLCKLLSVGQQQGSKPFNLSHWTITDYDTEGFDSSAEMSFLVLASHLYYRALKHVPSLVRLWWINCKNRQVIVAVESYTEKYFSQQLIGNEMDLVNRADIKEQLEDNDENEFTIKTSKSANEVMATYKVDEQNMQIAIKLPSNFPLRQIDVEGVQKVGVDEKRWRGWMLSVTAVIGSQNGNIVDALTIFKRNANLHFQGVEDCTICYSIISAINRSIPTKQCRTCKNKFHAICLYKWFRSSNSATCPLCRTVFN